MKGLLVAALLSVFLVPSSSFADWWRDESRHGYAYSTFAHHRFRRHHFGHRFRHHYPYPSYYYRQGWYGHAGYGRHGYQPYWCWHRYGR